MREIIFRGKRVDNGEWIEGDLCKFMNKSPCIMPLSYFATREFDSTEDLKEGFAIGEFFSVIPESISQFTGMIDRKGEYIFEGDVLTGVTSNGLFSKEPRKYEVMWGVDHWHAKGTYFTLQELKNHCNVIFEVTGNIHNS